MTLTRLVRLWPPFSGAAAPDPDPAPSYRTYTVEADDRTYVVPTETRTYKVPGESRTHIVAAR